MIIAFVILLLLIVPIGILYKFSIARIVATSPAPIGVIFGFTLIFTAVLSIFTKAKRHELLAASAG